MTHQTKPRATDTEIITYNLWQVLQQLEIIGIVVMLLFDGTDLQTYHASHFHARTKPEEIEYLVGALAMAAGVKNARVSRGDGVRFGNLQAAASAPTLVPQGGGAGPPALLVCNIPPRERAFNHWRCHVCQREYVRLLRLQR